MTILVALFSDAVRGALSNLLTAVIGMLVLFGVLNWSGEQTGAVLGVVGLVFVFVQTIISVVAGQTAKLRAQRLRQ